MPGVSGLVNWAESPGAVLKAAMLDLDSRLELFVDRYPLDVLDGTHLKLHSPRLTPRSERPPAGGGYATILKDGDLYSLRFREAT